MINKEPINQRRELTNPPKPITSFPNKPIRTLGDSVLRIPPTKPPAARYACRFAIVHETITPARRLALNRDAIFEARLKHHFENRPPTVANLRDLSTWQNRQTQAKPSTSAIV